MKCLGRLRKISEIFCKEHRYWSAVENVRNRDGRVVQRQVLYLGEINDRQRAAWCKSIEVPREDSGARTMALFAADREARSWPAR